MPPAELNGKWKWIIAILQSAIFIGLTIIIAGGWRFVNRSDAKDDDHEKRLRDLETINYNMGQAVLRFDEYQKSCAQWQQEHDKQFDTFKDMTQQQFLELWKLMPRGAKHNTTKDEMD